MGDYFEWFDPHERRAVADEAPSKISQARCDGYASGQSQMNHLLRSGVFDGIKEAAHALGRKVPNQPEFLEAVEKVTDGFAQNHDFRVSFESDPMSMAQMVFQEVNVRPFRVHMGVRFSERDMYGRRYG